MRIRRQLDTQIAWGSFHPAYRQRYPLIGHHSAATLAVFVLGLLCGGFIGWISWVWA
jgi:hypothetical protein